MAQRLSSLAALVGDQRTGVHFPTPTLWLLQLQFQGIRHRLLTSVGTRITHGAHAYIEAKHSYT